MAQLLPPGRVIRFGLFEADLETCELRKDGLPTRLQGRPFEILLILLQNPGRVVTREEFHQRLWPVGTFVDFDHSLNVAINKLRLALGDSADNPRFVATMGRRGYRFIAPTQPLYQSQPVAAPAEARTSDADRVQSGPAPGRRLNQRFGMSAGLMLALGALALVGLSRSSPPPQVKRIVQMTHSGTVFRDQLLTDGPRLYFREGVENNGTLQQMPIAGGASAAVAGIRPELIMEDFFLRTSELLMVDRDENHESLWVASLVSNSERRLGGMGAYSAASSPDGKRVAYTDALNMYIANSDGSDAHKLVTLPRKADCLRWSPDGARLRFVEDEPKPLQNVLWEIGSDGIGLRPLLPGWSESPREGCGNWTADGRYFFFESAHEGSRDIWAIREKTSWFGPKRSQPVRLTSGPLNFFSPTPSRDGNQLFVVGEQRRGELTRYDEKSKQFESFLGGISVNDLQFSHDGQWVAYVTYPDRTLWRSRADGSERLQLTTPPTRAFLPAWSPDDQRILFQGLAKPNQPWKIYLINPAGGTPEMLISDRDSQESGGTWSPDGKTVLYSYNKISASPSSSSVEIRVLDLTTKQITSLSGSQGLYAPEWSPDGRYLSALAAKDYLVLFDTTTQQWRTLLPLGVGYPSWSRDGQYIYSNTLWRKNPALIRVAVKSGRVEAFPVNFVAAGTYGAWSGVAPDGSFLLLRDRGSRDIYSLNLTLP
jgi:Tol biopolymer transport system component/DNA-binding winged helix-turn-helix (wHTH) protein